MTITALEPYPMTIVSFGFPFLKEKTDLIVIACADHFGVLVPMAKLEPKKKTDPEALIDRIVQEIVNYFTDLGKQYIEACDENEFTLPLPRPEDADDEFDFVVLKLSGRVGASNSIPPTTEDLVLDGEYLFVAEADVDISDFITSLDRTSTVRAMH